MDDSTMQAKIARKRAFEAELAKLGQPHDYRGFVRRAWLSARIRELENEIRQGGLPLTVKAEGESRERRSERRPAD
jgi:hypothetical protein